MTELLYMQDFDITRCNATIISIDKTDDEREDIILDKTSFYARGGGQDWDTGVIEAEGAIFRIDEVRMDESSQVHHIGKTTKGTFSVGDHVYGRVDEERRSINSRLHSAAHIIDMAVDSIGLDWIATKGQHYPDLSAVEYKGTWEPKKAEELKSMIAETANKFVTLGSENSLLFMPVEEMHKVCRDVPDNIPKNKPGRVVMYGEGFGIPCGGTHLKNIKDVGKINIPKLRQKKGIIRLSYTVDGINS